MERRAVIYCRISRDREGAGLGVDRQQADCEALADKLGWTVVRVLTDNDISAYSGKPRPGYKALLAALSAGEANAVIAWHTDRLHRSPRELEEYVDLCDNRKVVTQTVKAGFLDLATPSGRMVARQLGAVARFEVEHTIERQKRAKLQAASDGRWKGGRRPFGYAADGVTVVPAEAAALIAATDAVLAGASMHGVMRDWNQRKIPTTTGGKWTPTSVRKVLLRPRNAGLMEHRGEVVGDAEWPALVDADKWHALRALLTDPARTTTTGSARKYLGPGLYRCGICGEPVLATRTSKKRPNMDGKPELVTAYRCRTRQHVSRVASNIDGYVEGLVIERLSREDLGSLLATDQADVATDLHAEGTALRARLDEMAALYADGDITVRQLKEGTERLRAKLDDNERHIGVSVNGSTLAAFTAGKDPRKVWDGLDLDRRRAVIDTLMKVTIIPAPIGRRPGGGYFDPDSVTVEWRQP